MTRSIPPDPNYSSWTKSRLIERLQEYQGRKSELTGDEKIRTPEIPSREMNHDLATTLMPIYKDLQVGLCYLDTDLRFVAINDWLAEINGISAEEHIGLTLRDLIPEVAKGVEHQYRKVIETGEPIIGGMVEAETPSEPGITRIFQHSYYPVKSDDGDVVGISCIVEDVTRREHTEAERNRAEKSVRRLAAVVESTMDAVVTTDRDGIIADWNKGAERLFGYSSHEAIGNPGSMIFPEHLRHEFDNNFNSIRQGRWINNTDTIRRRKDGSLIDVSVSASPYDDGMGNFAGGSGIYRDITERKRIEAKLRQAQKMQALGQLAGGIAHDFNNLLFPITTITEVVIDELADDARARANLANVVAAAEQGRHLVQQIMAFIRQKPADHRELKIAEILTESIGLLKATIASTIEIRTSVDPNVGSVLADETQIQQVIMNLGANAVHAIGTESGKIEFSLSRLCAEEDFAVGADTLASGEYAKLAVIDTGYGMDEDTLAQIFDPYFTTKSFGEGTGMGLAAVHGIVASFGGAITASSAPRIGTTIECYLPVLGGP